MSDDLILYSNPMSRGRIARWMLEETGKPYRVEQLDFAAMKHPDFLAINPMGKVPTLAHRGAVVTEAAAICAYLADAFPEVGLAPAGTSADRAPYLRWLFFAAGPLEAALTNRSLGVDVPSGKQAMVGYGQYDHVLDTLEKAVGGGRHIAGERFSAADVYVGSQIGFGLMFKSIEPRPALVEYWQMLTARPAYIRASAADDAAMPPPPASTAG